MVFIHELITRNAPLFWFGLICFGLAAVLVVVSLISQTEVVGANAWYKPIKFLVSTAVYSWAMAWFIHYLSSPGLTLWSNRIIITMLGLELVYIIAQAARGQMSHFNVSTGFYNFMWVFMAFAATVVAVWTAVVAVRFFTTPVDLPLAYLWGIRLGLILFVIFAFEGFVMGARMSHSIGGEDGGPGLTFLGWSVLHGDPRVPHFIGMHALQVLPLLGFYLLKDVRLLVALGVLYAALAGYTLMLALNGKPLVNRSQKHAVTELPNHATSRTASSEEPFN